MYLKRYANQSHNNGNKTKASTNEIIAGLTGYI